MTRNLSDFKWYRKESNHKRYLAAWVSKDKSEEIGNRSGLWATAPSGAMVFGMLRLATPNAYVVLRVDQRNNRLMNIERVSKEIFEADFKLMDKQDYLVKE